MTVRLGAHVSTAGGMVHGVRQGVELGCEAVQVFTRNQRQWNPKPLDPTDAAAFKREGKKAGFLPASVSHASYLINLCATDSTNLARSRKAFVDEIDRCAALNIRFLCVHPGSHLGAGEDAGLAEIAANVRAALAATERVTVLLENTAGQGTNLGWRLEHLRDLVRAIGGRRVAVCLDTCHLFAAGYDLKGAYDDTMEEIDRVLGLRRIKALHLNDSQHPCGSRKDRHAHIGEGEIGAAAFRRLVNDPRLAGRPALLETPGGPDGYRKNLHRLRKMRKP